MGFIGDHGGKGVAQTAHDEQAGIAAYQREGIGPLAGPFQIDGPAQFGKLRFRESRDLVEPHQFDLVAERTGEFRAQVPRDRIDGGGCGFEWRQVAWITGQQIAALSAFGVRRVQLQLAKLADDLFGVLDGLISGTLLETALDHEKDQRTAQHGQGADHQDSRAAQGFGAH